VNPNDPNVGMLQLVSQALGHLKETLVFVGGCATGLLVTEEARPPARVTIDVDLVAEVGSIAEYYLLSEQLKELGFVEDVGDISCRWRLNGLIVDVMPTSNILGFTNRWYEEAIKQATEISLPNGDRIRVISAPMMLATKLEAFHGRGQGDYMASRDIEDFITIVDGRVELMSEVAKSSEEVQIYLREEIDDLLSDNRFVDSVAGHLHPDAASQARLALVIERLRALAGI
jgi:predicted nucleotidyltransferase